MLSQSPLRARRSTQNDVCPHCGTPYRYKSLVELYPEMARSTLRPPDIYYRVACECPAAVAEAEAWERLQEEARAKLAEEARRERLLKSGVPATYLDAFPDEDKAEAVLDGRGFYIVGSVGTGKTMMACSVIRALYDMSASYKATFVTVPDLYTRLRATYDKGGESELQVMSELGRCDLLVLDDLGKGVPTGWAMEKLFQVVNRRCADGKPVIVTTQYERPQLYEVLSSNGDSEGADAMLSRLAKMCETVKVTGPDRRMS